MKTDIIENLPGEEWRDIEGYEDLYQVSNKGRVKSLSRKLKNGVNSYFISKDRILKPANNGNGYLVVQLTKDNKNKMKLVHRLVAETFIPNPEHKPCINHLSEIKTENNVENLEWVSIKDNNNYGTHIERITRTVRSKVAKQIKCFDLQINEITFYPSIIEASRQLNISSTAVLYNLNKSKKPYKNRYIFSEA